MSSQPNVEMKPAKEWKQKVREAGLYGLKLIDVIGQIQADAQKSRDRHWGDCAIYSAMINGDIKNGICDCGYGRIKLGNGDMSELFSAERLESLKLK